MVIYAAISAIRKLLQKVYQESETSLCPTVWDSVSKRNKSFFPSNFDGLEVQPGVLRTQESTPQLFQALLLISLNLSFLVCIKQVT